jgi:hypothetical protein
MELFIIFVLLVVIGLMYNNKKEADNREKERIDPGYLERKETIDRIIAKLKYFEAEDRNRIAVARKNGKSISFWTHTKPTKTGHYKVKYQEESSYLQQKGSEYDILFYKSVLFADEWGNYSYDFTYVQPPLITGTAYWDGLRFDVKNVRYYFFEMN